MLRWASERSLDVYCRPTADDYSRNLASAMEVADHNATSAVWRHKDNSAHLASQLSDAMSVPDTAATAAASTAPVVDDACFYDAWDKASSIIVH